MKFAYAAAIIAVCLAAPHFAHADDNVPPEGFVALFNGQDLTGWRGLPLVPHAKDPSKLVPMSMPQRLQASPDELAAAQQRGDESAREHWKVVDGVVVFDGKGQNLITDKEYGDFELYVDWKIEKDGDSGIYVRGSPQIQIWDPDVSPKYHNGERVGSGGMFNNQKNPNKALKIADKPVGEWNTFWIKMVGERVTVKLNGETVVDDVVLENYWDRTQPIYPRGTIELQNHGNTLYFKNIYLKALN